MNKLSYSVRLFWILLFLFAIDICIAQSNYQRSIGGLGKDCGDAIISTSDGGYAIAGLTTSFGAGADDVVIVKLDASGNILWQKTFGSATTEIGNSLSIIETPDGGLVVTGILGKLPGAHHNLYVFKTDANGNLLWDNQYNSGPGVSAGSGSGILTTQDGNLIILGNDDRNSIGSNDALAIKVDNDGNLIWKWVFGGTGPDFFYNAIELKGGNVLISGTSRSFGPGFQSAYLLKLDSQGNVIWANTYGNISNERFTGCDTTHNGFIMTGLSQSFGAGDSDILLCKTDTAGVVQWTRTFGGPLYDVGSTVLTLPGQQGYLIAGLTYSFGNEKPDIIIFKTDTDGNLVWARTFGTQGFEAIEPLSSSVMALTIDGGFVLTGWSDSLSVGMMDILFIKSDGDGGALCKDVTLTVKNVDLISQVTNTQSGDAGAYSDVTSIDMNSGMVMKDQCKCISGEACLPCYKTIVHYNLNDCVSLIGDISEMDYSEFVPVYPDSLEFAMINAGNVYRHPPIENKHSCTPGVGNSTAMCVSALNSCTYTTTSDQAIVIELNITPATDSAVIISSLKFYEKAPANYNWINGASGLNNYPTRFGIRIWKNDIPIFSENNISTSVDAWKERIFDFASLLGFRISEPAIVRIELLGYCLIGNGATVAAWDLDEISLVAECEPYTLNGINVSGFVRDVGNNGVSGVLMTATNIEDPNFNSAVLTDDAGGYILNNLQPLTSYSIKAFRNDDPLYKVDLFDLIRIQKHLIGLKAFTSPYQKIAADLNDNRSISVMDLVELRKLLLRHISEFTKNSSWRFGIAGQQLLLSDPWLFDEVFEIHTTEVDIGNAHFRAVKIGDVTGEEQD